MARIFVFCVVIVIHAFTAVVVAQPPETNFQKRPRETRRSWEPLPQRRDTSNDHHVGPTRNPIRNEPDRYAPPPPGGARERPFGPPFGSPFGPPGVPSKDWNGKFMFLLENHEVIEAIKLTSEQKERLETLRENSDKTLMKDLAVFWKSSREKVKDTVQGLPPEAWSLETIKEIHREQQPIFENASRRLHGGLKELLDDEQWRKLHRVSFALSGGLTGEIPDESYYLVLDVTPEQKEAIQNLTKAFRETTAQLHEKFIGKYIAEGKNPPRNHFHEFMIGWENLKAEQLRKIESEILTDAQRNSAGIVMKEEAELVNRVKNELEKRHRLPRFPSRFSTRGGPGGAKNIRDGERIGNNPEIRPEHRYRKDSDFLP